jgi:hypothetical protein
MPPGQGRSFVTIAQLVHPALGLARLPRRALFRVPHRADDRRRSRNAMLWRAIGAGLALALIGLVMVVAIGATDVGSVVSAPPEGVPVGTHPTPAHRLEIYQDPAEAFGWAMPVP